MTQMQLGSVNIRDPYVLFYDNHYYLYGTRSTTAWTEAYGFDCYVSQDLESWKGPFEIFSRPEGFWATHNYWAPECYFYNKAFYLVTTFGAAGRNKGIQVLKANSPLGPFAPMTNGPITPEGWNCIDGTLFFDKKRGPVAYLQPLPPR